MFSLEPTGTERAELPRRQRLLLPGAVLESGGGRRTPRDWLVDVLMTVVAVTLGAMALADTWDDHSDAAKVLDIALGVVCLAALWKRRSHPVAVAAFTLTLSLLSGSAAGAGVLALSARRCAPRAGRSSGSASSAWSSARCSRSSIPARAPIRRRSW